MTICVLMPSCAGDKDLKTVQINVDELPILHDEDISILISDSGIICYRLKAKVMDIYVNDTTSYWYFPQGIYVEQFDSMFHVVGFIRADTAYYYEKIELWRLIGNIYIKNLSGTICETTELFWNRKEPTSSNYSIYTDKFVKITIKDKLITAQGMHSNQSLSRCIFYASAFEATIDESEFRKESKIQSGGDGSDKLDEK